MKKHEVVTKENYREIVLKRTIISCWIILAICFIIKIFGGNFFNIVCETEEFVKFCNYCDTSFVRYIIYFAYFMFETIMFALILTPNKPINKFRFILYLIFSICFWIVKILVESKIIKIKIEVFSIISLIILYLLLLMYSKKPLYSFVIIIYQFVLVFISSVIKNISFSSTLTNSMLMTVIFFIDYYIELILTFLYVRVKILRKEE